MDDKHEAGAIDHVQLRAFAQRMIDRDADLGDMLALSHFRFDQLIALLDERERLRGAIREAISFLESDPPEMNVRDHINKLRAALGDEAKEN